MYREYPLFPLAPAALYDPAAEPEDELMLQGRVDCAFRTEQGLVIVDFKTDRIRPEEAPRGRELYRPPADGAQPGPGAGVETPVAEMVLYFFAPGCEVQTGKIDGPCHPSGWPGLYYRIIGNDTGNVSKCNLLRSGALTEKASAKNPKFFHIYL